MSQQPDRFMVDGVESIIEGDALGVEASEGLDMFLDYVAKERGIDRHSAAGQEQLDRAVNSRLSKAIPETCRRLGTDCQASLEFKSGLGGLAAGSMLSISC